MTARLLNRAERLAQIEQVLSRSAQGMRAVEIAAACGVDRRTIYRDLALLSETGVPVSQTYGRFFIDRAHYTPAIRLTLYESVMLMFAASLLSRLGGRGEQHYLHLQSAAEKLRNLIPASLTEYEHPVNSGISADETMTDLELRQQVIFAKLVQAWIDRRQVKVRYRSRTGKMRVMVLETYFVDCKPNGTLYIVGLDVLSQRVYSLKMRRIDKIRRLDMTYQLPNAAVIRKYMWNTSGSGEIHSPTDDSSMWSAST